MNVPQLADLNETPDRDAAKAQAFRLRVEQFKEDYRAQQTARDELRADLSGTHAPNLDSHCSTLTDELAEPIPERKYAVNRLATSGAIVTLPSSRKTGKTTFLANLGESGVDDVPFLGMFPAHLNGSIAAVNAEMMKADYLDAYRKLGISNTSRIIPLHCRENGIRLNLLDDATVERFTDWLVKREAEWLFLDPWKNFLAWAGIDGNDNGMVNRLMTRVQEIQAAAGIKLTVIAMHTTQTPQGAGYERAKGAGEVEDSADAMWRYVRSEGGRGGARVLSVEGRGGVGLDETVVHFDAATGRLTLGEGDRNSAEISGISPDVIKHVAEHPDACVRDIQDAMVAIGHDQKPVRQTIKKLVSEGTLITSKGDRGAILHRLSPVITQ